MEDDSEDRDERVNVAVLCKRYSSQNCQICQRPRPPCHITLMSVSRPIHANEIYFIQPFSREMVQLCIEFDHPKYVAQVVETFKKSIVGLHVKTDGKNLIHTDAPVDVASIPSRLRTPAEVCNWMDTYCVPFLSDRLATLAYDDRRVAFNSSHICADGGFLTFLLQNCLNPNLPPAPPLPSTLHGIFDKHLEAFKRAPISLDDAGSMTFWDWPKGVDPKPKGRVRAKFVEHFQPAKELAGYENGKVKALTEYLWCGTALSLSAMNGILEPTLGCVTCVNLRNLVEKKDADLSFCNIFTNTHIKAGNAGANVPIGEVMKQMRNRFEFLKKNHGIVAGIEREFFTNFKNNASVAHVTNVGPLKYGPPIADFYMQQTMEAEATNPVLSVLSYSKIGRGHNDVLTRLRYSPLVVSDENATLLESSIRFFLKNVTPNMTVGEVFNELQRFQKSQK